MSLSIKKSIISPRPGMLREGFLEEAWSELSRQGEVRTCQTNKAKCFHSRITWAKTWETKKAVTLGEELMVSVVRIILN